MNKLKNLFRIQSASGFLGNVLVTFSGAAGASLISLLLTPVVTRLFDPDDFGRLSFLIVLTTNLGLVSTMAFPQALVVAKSRSVFYQLVRISLLLLCVWILLIAGFSWTWGMDLLPVFNMQAIGRFIWFLPLLVLLNELNRIGLNWNVRRKRFRANAAAALANNAGMRLSQIVYGLLYTPGFFGLLQGNLLAYFLRVMLLFRNQWREFYRLFFRIRLSALKPVVWQFRNYPRWVFPAVMIDAISAALPVYLLAVYYDATVVGHFSFAQSLLNHPYVMLSASVMPVFFQRANELYQEGLPRLQKFVQNIYYRLLVLGAVVFGAAVFFSDLLLPLIFGSKWAVSGVFAGSLAIYFSFRFIAVPLMPVFRVLRKEPYDFISSGGQFIFRTLSLVYGVWYLSPEQTILLFSVAGSIPCIISILLVFRLIKQRVWPIIWRSFLIFAAAFGAFWGLRMLF
ncbi:MAG: oligosaccharide flippase family protein [Bacteroidetes bacterium]|nr:oligosaccharide flippase family protein [Bacteroidota bacterium]